MDLLFRINDGGTCVVFSTHDHEIVKTFGERVMIVQGGRIRADVDWQEISFYGGGGIATLTRNQHMHVAQRCDSG